MTARTVGEIAAAMSDLGVSHGDSVMVHASLRALGPVEGGAAGVIEAIDAAVGDDGTVLMVLGAPDDGQPFDYLVTPADPDVGVLAEVFRQTPGTVVNDHPDGRFGARGAGAAALLAGGPWDDYYGPGSPLERLVGLSGKILRLGADQDTLTLLHYAEYLVPLPSKRRVRREHVMAGPDGPRSCVVECLDDSNGIVDYPGEDYFAVILREYIAAGRAACGTVGDAPSQLIEAADVVGFAVAWMAERFIG